MNVYVFVSPWFAVVDPSRETIGATFATVTVNDSLSVPPFVSVTVTVTVYVFGPSA